MTVQHLGSKSLGACMPSSLEAMAALQVQLPKIEAQIAGLIALQAKLSIQPPTLAASLDAALAIAASIEAAISLGMPGVDFQLAAVLELLAQLQIELASITAALAISVSLGAAGVHLYAYSGQAAQLGGEFQSELATGFPGGQPTDQTYAVMLATTLPATKIALEAVFQVSF